MRFVFLDPLDRLGKVFRRFPQESRRWARKVEKEFAVHPRYPLTVFATEAFFGMPPGMHVGGVYDGRFFLLQLEVDGVAYHKHPNEVFQELIETFVHEYVHFLAHNLSGMQYTDRHYTLLHDIWVEMLTTHAECRIAGRKQRPIYTKVRSRRELMRLMQEMREDLRKSALRVREVWRFPGLHSPNHWGVYKVAWALGERYLRDHSFAQAIRATSREMRRAYDEVLAELSGNRS